MEHNVHAGHRRCGDLRIAEVALDDLDAGQVLEVLRRSARQVIHHSHLGPLHEQVLDEVAADEPRPAGNEHTPPRPRVGPRGDLACRLECHRELVLRDPTRGSSSWLKSSQRNAELYLR